MAKRKRLERDPALEERLRADLAAPQTAVEDQAILEATLQGPALTADLTERLVIFLRDADA